MENIKFNEETLVESREAREEYMERTEVLDKVKHLFLIPGMECLTTGQVAEFYEVKQIAIRAMLNDHRDEFESDGVCKKALADFREANKSLDVTLSHDQTNPVEITQKRGYVVLSYGDQGRTRRRIISKCKRRYTITIYRSAYSNAKGTSI